MFAPVAAATEDGSSLQTPVVQFQGTGPGTVTATIHNPNDRGVCWALADIGAEFGTIFGGDRPESPAGPGATIKASLQGLPAGTIQTTGICGFRYPVQDGDYTWSLPPITVNVPGAMPSTGSFG
jgi:hypothetical protein